MDLSTALKRVHPEEGEEDNDVGLRPVCLPLPGLPYSNMTAVVAGWGTTEEGGSVSNTLQEVKHYKLTMAIGANSVVQNQNCHHFTRI